MRRRTSNSAALAATGAPLDLRRLVATHWIQRSLGVAKRTTSEHNRRKGSSPARSSVNVDPVNVVPAVVGELHAPRITPLGDYPGDNCQRLRATRGDWQPAYLQLERPIELHRGWSGGPLTSLTRKRSLVQSQYRPPVQLCLFEHPLVA
jgi:hypothetical protein